MPWDPDQYARFRAERRRPWEDLVALVAGHCDAASDAAAIETIPETIIDLGCGTGELTGELHRRLGARRTLGLDSSESMLAGSDAFAGDGVTFARGDIAAFAGLGAQAGEADEAGATARRQPPEHDDQPGQNDLVFSNAALHWVPGNMIGHERLIAGLLARARPGGLLAFQVPANADHPSHRTAADVAAEPPFAAALADAPDDSDGGDGGDGMPRVLDTRGYAELLYRLGVRDMDVSLRIYGHELPARDDVVEWVKGSLLTAYERRLPADLYARFVQRYRELLAARLPDTRPYFYTYRRVFVCARVCARGGAGDRARRTA